MIIVGIDPGTKGAVAILQDGKFKAVVDMPYEGKRLLVGEVTDWIGAHGKPDQVWYERQAGQHNNGGSRAFNAGYNYGLLEWQLDACYGFKANEVTPQKWKRRAGLIGQDKKASIRKARDLFPEAENWLKRISMDDGRAEALLIAYYGG